MSFSEGYDYYHIQQGFKAHREFGMLHFLELNVIHATTGHLRSHSGVPACMQSGARLSIGYRHDCPRPLRGGGGARSAGGVGSMKYADLRERQGRGKPLPVSPTPDGDNHHGPRHEDTPEKKDRPWNKPGPAPASSGGRTRYTFESPYLRLAPIGLKGGGAGRLTCSAG
jgi:hypothetical protein